MPASTLDGLDANAPGPGASWARRAFLGVLALVVLAGAVGVLGLHTSTTTASGHGYDLTLRYPWVSRAGLDTTWQVRVRHAGGFSKPITVAVTGSYFDIFETQGFHPDASKSTRDGDTLYLQFDPPPGDTFVVDFDAYIQPSSQQGRDATVAVVTGSTRPVPLVSVRFATRLLP